MMIKAAALDKELFIVLLPEGDVFQKAQKFQKVIAEHYNLYDKKAYPQLHITLNRISKDSVQAAKDIVKNIVKISSPVELIVKDLTCFRIHNTSLVLRVEKTQSLQRLADNLHSKLRSKGISTISDYESWDFHITIVSNLFARQPLSNRELNAICHLLEGQLQVAKATAKCIEIWRPILDPDLKRIESFLL